MSRWLQLAKSEAAFDASTNSTKLRLEAAQVRNVEIVEVSNEGLASFPRLAFSAPNADDDAVALVAIKAGDRSYGAIATTTGMGATRAYKAVERLQAAGRVGRDMKATEVGE